MAQPPPMPPVPPPGQADGQAVYNSRTAVRYRARKHLGGALTEAERGDDFVRIVETACAAIDPNFPANAQQAHAQLQAQMAEGFAQLQAQMAEGFAQLQAQLTNLRARAQNSAALLVQEPVPLVRLVKEQAPPAGAAAVGALPPANVFPGTWAAVDSLSHQQLTALANFYGVQFGGQGQALAARRRLFKVFIHN